MRLPERIAAKSDVMMGKPCIKGTRIPVYILLQKLAAGESFEELLAAYPQLKAEDLRACLEYAAAQPRTFPFSSGSFCRSSPLENSHARYFCMTSQRVPSLPTLKGLPQMDAFSPRRGTALPM